MSTPHDTTLGFDADPPASAKSPFTCAFADRIDFVRPDDWDSLADGASIFLSRDYLRLNEQSGPQELGHRYAVVYRGLQPVAAIACQSLDVDGTRLVNLADAAGEVSALNLKQSVRSLGQKALRTLRRRFLCCGNLLSWGEHGWAVARGEDPAAVWNGVSDALYRIRRADKRAGSVDYLMVKDVLAPTFTGGAALDEAGYHSLETEPEMQLELPGEWRTYDDYLGSLASKYRKATLGVRDAVTQAGCIVEPLGDVASQRHVLHRLYENVASRSETRLIHLPPDYLPSMAEAFGPDRFRITIIRRDDQIVGFVSTLRDGETVIGYYIGFDYAANAEIPVYLRLLQAVVEDAMRMGVRRVSFGRTALEPKARLGARPVPTRVWIRHRVPVLNSVVRHLLKAVPHEEAPERNPFKSKG